MSVRLGHYGDPRTPVNHAAWLIRRCGDDAEPQAAMRNSSLAAHPIATTSIALDCVQSAGAISAAQSSAIGAVSVETSSSVASR
jgi:hypothetical protein